MIKGDTLLLLLNAHHEPLPFTLPETKAGHVWERLFDTADPSAPTATATAGEKYPLQARSMALLRTRPIDEAVELITPLHLEAIRKELLRHNLPSERPAQGPGS